jgi:VWFA-related protein
MTRLSLFAVVLGLTLATAAMPSAQQQGGAQQGGAQQGGGQQGGAQQGGAQGGGRQGGQPAAQTPSAADVAQQARPGDPAQPTFRGGINFVRVDVIVTDRKGQPVTDLKETDFEVLEDKKPQTVEQFRLIRVDGNPRPGEPPPRQIRTPDDVETEVARDDVRVFVLFFDDYHVRLGNSLGVRNPLTRFVREQLRPNDIVGIMYPLTPLADMTFTRNPEAVISAIEKFQGRKFDYTPRNQFEEYYSRYPTEVVEQVRNDVVMSALRGLAIHLGSLREARKSIIYVSEGLTASLPPQMRRADASMPAIPGLTGAMMGENSSREQTYEFFNQSDVYSKMRDVFDAANRNNAAFYTLDPRGLATFEFDINEGAGFESDKRYLQATQDTLRVLAAETDGRAIVNRNDLNAGLAQLIRDSSYYYLMGYTSAAAPTDGKFHDITVRLKRNPNGYQLRARKGYWAYTASDAVLATKGASTPEVAKPVQQALASISTAVQSARYIRTWIGTERGESGKTRVTLIWEPLPQQPGVRRDQPGRVSVIAANQKGDLVFRGRSPDAALASTAAPTTPSAQAATTPQRLVFDAPPGNLELRLSVEAAGGGGVLDNDIRTVVIPDLTTPDAALSTPRVYRARNAREFQTIAADTAAVPVAGRDFSRADRLLIRFDVYGNATPTAVLLNRSGQKMTDVPVAAAPQGGSHQIDMGLNTVPAGEYLIEITVKGAMGDAKELVPIRIGA